jgi:hypothetical protein
MADRFLRLRGWPYSAGYQFLTDSQAFTVFDTVSCRYTTMLLTLEQLESAVSAELLIAETYCKLEAWFRENIGVQKQAGTDTAADQTGPTLAGTEQTAIAEQAT